VYVVVLLVIVVVVVVVLVVGGGCRSCGPLRSRLSASDASQKRRRTYVGTCTCRKPWTTHHTAVSVERDVSLAISRGKARTVMTNVVDIALTKPTEMTSAGRCTWDRDVRDG
jgi:hypothetical protein